MSDFDVEQLGAPIEREPRCAGGDAGVPSCVRSGVPGMAARPASGLDHDPACQGAGLADILYQNLEAVQFHA